MGPHSLTVFIVYTVSINVLKLYLGSHVLMNIVILSMLCAYEYCYLRC